MGRAAAVSAVICALGAVGVVGAAPAAASDLTCTGPPGTETVLVDGTFACGSRSDDTSRAFARALDSVAFAAADLGGNAVGLSQGGAVAAAETASGQVAALAVGPGAVSIVSSDPGTIAFAASSPQGQTSVGTAVEGVRCDAGLGVAANLTVGQACLSDGITTWTVR